MASNAPIRTRPPEGRNSHLLRAQVLCLLSVFALTTAEIPVETLSDQKPVETSSESKNIADELGQLVAASTELHAATTKLKATAQTTKLSSGASVTIPKITVRAG